MADQKDALDTPIKAWLKAMKDAGKIKPGGKLYAIPAVNMPKAPTLAKVPKMP